MSVNSLEFTSNYSRVTYELTFNEEWLFMNLPLPNRLVNYHASFYYIW